MKKQKPETTHSLTINGRWYHIRRRGSRYNIFGPNGRVFTKYASAGIVGPRWEELTRTVWPHASSAYQPGSHLQQLAPSAVLPKQSQPAPPAADIKPPSRSPAKAPQARQRISQKRRSGNIELPKTKFNLPTQLALPEPRIDLAKQARLIRQLRQNPALLFDPRIRQALNNEVEYHLPYAAWAERLLILLSRFERRRRKHPSLTPDQETILARHVAWQEQKMSIRSFV